jgi:hypothetical protein
MIWNKDSGKTASPVVDVIVDEAAKVAAATGTESPVHIRAVAEAVGHYLAESRAASVNSETLLCLAGEALKVVGQGGMAARLALFGTGLVRSQEWVFAGDDLVWVIDLGRIGCSGDACTDLAFYRSLAVVIAAMSEVWDGTGGKGLLGLRNLTAAAPKMGHAGLRQTAEFRKDVTFACVFFLEQQKKARN